MFKILSILGCLSIILLLFVNREIVVAQTSSTQKFSQKNQSSKQNPSVSKTQYTLLQSFKDPLFSYKSIIEQEADGKYSLISYSQTRDLEERDTIPEKKVSSDYVNLTGVNKYRKEKTFSYWGKDIGYIEVTKAGEDIQEKEIQYLVMYIHGLNGHRSQGVNDWSFGGNFNRIQNLMLNNKGSYISTDFSNFGVLGMSEVRELIRIKRTQYPKARVFIACGSSGGDICWWLAKDQQGNKLIHGLLLLGSNYGHWWLNGDQSLSLQRTRLLPIFIAHGEKDRSIGMKWQRDFLDKVLSKNKNYPIRMHVFTNGTHGTPIRMVDWKTVLNWMIKNS